MPTISLCMIVKNEEKTLSRALKSVVNYVDELIIVDTGSTDATKEIASQYGAKVFDYAWSNDFGKARQFAKEQATCDWILQLDADEYFEESEIQKIRHEVDATYKMGITLRIQNVVNTLGQSLIHQSCRLYRNIPEISYLFRIHEQVAYQGDVLSDLAHANINVLHTGYDSETTKEKNKRQRNLRILKEELKEKPGDTFMNFNIANEYFALHEYRKALDHYKKSYKAGKQKIYASRAIARIIQCLIELKQYGDAHTVLNEAKGVYNGFTDLYYLEGELFEKEGRMFEAIQAFEICLEKGESLDHYITNKGVGSLYPLHKLASLAIQQRNFEQAMNYSLTMMNVDKFNRENVERVISILRHTSTEEEVVQFLNHFYTDTDRKELEFKLSVMHSFRMKKGISKYYQNIKEESSSDNLENDFYTALYQNDIEKTRKILTKMANDNHEKAGVITFIYSLQNPDYTVEQKWKDNRTFTLLSHVLHEKEPAGKSNKYDSTLYLGVMKELMLIKAYETFEKLLPTVEYFGQDVKRLIGDLFYDHYMDDLAVQFYSAYLQKHTQDTAVLMKVAEMLYAAEMYTEASDCAKRVVQIRKQYFRPLEIIIESYHKQGEEKAVKALCQEALKTFPESIYIEKIMRSVM